MTYPNFIMTIHEIRSTLEHNENISNEQLMGWVQDVNSIGDFWSKTQLAKILAIRRPNVEQWGLIVLGWTVQAARKRSWWTEELIQTMIQGWKSLFLTSRATELIATLHPVSFARCLNEYIEKGEIQPSDVPAAILIKLASRGDTLKPEERLILIRLFRNTRRNDPKWGLKVLSWMNECKAHQSKCVAYMIKEFIQGWPNLLESNHTIRALTFNQDLMAKALSFAIINKLVDASELPSFLIGIVQKYGHQGKPSLTLHKKVG